MQFIATHVLCSVTTLCMSVCKQLNTGLACEWCRTTTWKLTVCGLALHHKWNQGHPPHHTAQVTSRLAGQRQRLETVGPSLLWALQLIPLPRFYVRLLGHSARSRVPWHWESCRQAPYCPGFCSKSLTVVTSDYVFSDSVYQQSYCAVSIVCCKHHKMAESVPSDRQQWLAGLLLRSGTGGRYLSITAATAWHAGHANFGLTVIRSSILVDKVTDGFFCSTSMFVLNFWVCKQLFAIPMPSTYQMPELTVLTIASQKLDYHCLVNSVLPWYLYVW